METIFLNYTNNPKAINSAVNLLKNGNVGIFPTDTVYGIGCDALNIDAIENLYRYKKRSLDKPINILVSNIDMLKKLVTNINPIEEKLIKNFWPGDLTIIFDKSEIVPDILTSGLSTVGIRIPNNKVCLDMINSFDCGIATSSANISDAEPSNEIDKISESFINKVSFILYEEKLNTEIPSTIVRVENNEIKILRLGSITKNDILNCFGGNINVR